MVFSDLRTMWFHRQQKLKLLFVATEATPFAKAGGLGEVMYALPRALQRIGHDARVMIPRYGSIDLKKFPMAMVYEGLAVPTGTEKPEEPEALICNVKRYASPQSNGTAVQTYFLENQEYYEKRSNIYGYSDDPTRWMLLCRGALEFVKNSREWVPDLLIASDWQTGFLVNDLRTTYRNDPRLKHIGSVFMIHNLAYQGMFDHHFVTEMDYDDGQSALPSFFDPRLLKINGMRRGIMHSDAITTVSPTYAREIMSKEYGELLDELLRERRSRLYGVMNGINYDDFNPQEDGYLVANYGADTPERRAANKTELQARFGLEPNKAAFLVGIVSRFSEQKGFDLLFPVTDLLLRELDMQLVVLGSGEAKYMGFFKDLETRFPGRVGTHLQFDSILPRTIYGGADAILIPSKFEPSGLTQLEAMRYGAIPIVRRTGGLADTVEDYREESGGGTGFVFQGFDPMAMMVAVVRAAENYRHKSVWRGIQRRGMLKDFSWTKSASEYAHIFTTAVGFRREAVRTQT